MKNILSKYWYTYAVIAVGILATLVTFNLKGVVLTVATGFLSSLALFYYEQWKEAERLLGLTSTRAADMEATAIQAGYEVHRLKSALLVRSTGFPIAVIGHRGRWIHFKDCLEAGSREHYVHVERPEHLMGREFAGVVLLSDHNGEHLQLLEVANTRIRHVGA